ncbi:hypothetical protein LCGC14_2094690, partial [marine sediment metagenome]
LGGLIGLSERGLYRYVRELRRLDFPIISEDCGYALDNEGIIAGMKLGVKGEPEDKLGVKDDPEEKIPFLPCVIYVELGEGSAARVNYELVDGSLAPPEFQGINLEQMNTLQVNLIASGVKVEAIQADQGMGSVLVRWR